MLIFYHLYLLFYHLFYQIQKPCLVFDTFFSGIQVCFFNSLLNGKYSNLLIVAAFSNKSFSSKTPSPVKNSYLLTFPDDKAEILAVCLSKLYLALFYSISLLIILIFSLTVILQ